jgi:hypothetical protein
MDKVYHLDLQTLLEYLQGQSALLATEVMMPGQREPGTGFLFFKNATIIGCVIQGAGAVTWREGEPAYQMLQDNTEWRVRMDPDIEQTLWLMKQRTGGLPQQPPYASGSLSQHPQHPPPQPAAPPVYAPKPVRSLDLGLLQPFTAKQRLILRMTYALVNGQRTPEQIKGQLRLPAETVDEALRSLYSLGVIQ